MAAFFTVNQSIYELWPIVDEKYKIKPDGAKRQNIFD
jgi:hypothetical protein